MEKAIKKEFSGNAEKTLLSVLKAVMDPAAYFAERLYKAMKGLGTNDKVLMRVIITRDEIDMDQIRSCYQSLYHKTLVEAVRSDTSGDYRKILVELCGH